MSSQKSLDNLVQTLNLEKLEEDGIAILSEDKKIWSLN